MPRITKNWVRTPTKTKCDRRSYRAKKVARGKVLLTFCCPKGQWSPGKGRCKKSMKLAEKATRR